MSGAPGQNVQVIYGGDLSDKILEISKEKIYTSAAEDAAYPYGSFNRKETRNSSTKSITSKKPCYVYVDHSYNPENKMPIHRLKKIIKTETTFSSTTGPVTSLSNSMPTTLVKTDRKIESQRLETSDYSVNNYFQNNQQQANEIVYSHKLADLLTKSCSNNTGVGVIGSTLGQLDQVNSISDAVKSTTHTESSESFKSSNDDKSCRVSQEGSTSSSVTSSIIMSNNNLINDLNIYREHLEFNGINNNDNNNILGQHFEDETIYGQVYLNNSQRIYQSFKSGELRRDLKNETSV